MAPLCASRYRPDSSPFSPFPISWWSIPVKDTTFYESLESLLKKVKTTLPPETIKYLENVEQTLHLAIKPYKDYGRFKEIINRVTDAALNRKTIEIVYYTMSRKKETRRKVDPYKVWFFNGTFYLIGLCHMRNEVRIFALDRIKMLHQTRETFEVPKDFNPDDFMESSFGVYQGTSVHIKVWLHPDVAGYIKECVDRKGKPFKGRNCARKVAVEFRFMEADMYNLVPAIGEINGLRSNYSFAMIPGEKREFGKCDMEIENRKAEPPPEKRGDIARTYFYMDWAYPGHGVISNKNKKLFQTWDKEDPVDPWECERCKRIEEIQGNENPFVKKPCGEKGIW